MWNSISTSKLMESRLKYIEHQKHRNNLMAVKPALDNKSPYYPLFLKSRSKQKLNYQERIDEIDKQNQLLLDKMVHIEKTPAKINCENLFAEYRTTHIAPEAIQRFYFQKKVQKENKLLMKRMTNIVSSYSRKKWNDHKKQDIYMQQNLSLNARRGFCVDYTNAVSFSKTNSNFYEGRLPSANVLKGCSEIRISTDGSELRTSGKRQSLKQSRPLTSQLSRSHDHIQNSQLDKMHFL